jgi:hypothetical protein
VKKAYVEQRNLQKKDDNAPENRLWNERNSKKRDGFEPGEASIHNNQ